MQQEIKNWIGQSAQLKTQLETWVATVNSQDHASICNLYHEKARLFPTFGTLKQNPQEVKSYFESADIFAVKIHYGSLSYHPDERQIEGDYTYRLLNGGLITSHFAFKFNREGKIVEHASAPKNINSWRVRNEVNICTLLTASTVQLVLKRGQAITAVA